MGISKGPAILLMKEALRKPMEGRLLTLGKQGVSISLYQLERYANIAGFTLPSPLNRLQNSGTRQNRPFEAVCDPSFSPTHEGLGSSEGHGRLGPPSQTASKSSIFPGTGVLQPAPLVADRYAPLQDHDFFPLLGFSEMQSLDYSSYEGASIQFDLNSGETPEIYREAFDVIYDGGTIEHIFHLPNVLKNLVCMLKPGGRLIHLNPVSNHLEHSFYQFSPTFFYDFYRLNGFEINYIQILRYTACSDHKLLVYDYHPGCFHGTDVGSGRLDTAMYMVHTVVTKTASSTGHLIPNQSMYSADMWVNANSMKKVSCLSQHPTLRKWKQQFKQSLIYPFYAWCKLKLRRHGIPLQPTDQF